MSIKSDKWIRRMAEDHGMIEPFEPAQVRNVDGRKIISYGTSSYGYDIRCAPEFKVFTNIHSTVVDPKNFDRSEEHTSELQSPCNLVCRLLLEKKKSHRSVPSTSTHSTTSITRGSHASGGSTESASSTSCAIVTRPRTSACSSSSAIGRSQPTR